MELALLSLLSALLFSVEGAAVKSVAGKLKLCSSNDPDLNECFRGAVESAFRTLKDGDKSLGLVPLDPLFVPEMGISSGNGPIGLNLKFINCSHYGISTSKVLSAKVSPDKQRFDLKMSVPSFTLSGPYEASGKILLLPITGKGLCNITLYNSAVDWSFHGNPVKKGENTYFELDEYKVQLMPNEANVHFGNLFNGDPILGKTTNLLLNQNSREVMLELAPDLNRALSLLHRGLAQRILDRLPWEEAFP